MKKHTYWKVSSNYIRRLLLNYDY